VCLDEQAVREPTERAADQLPFNAIGHLRGVVPLPELVNVPQPPNPMAGGVIHKPRRSLHLHDGGGQSPTPPEVTPLEWA
jgi:hypothetical protein